MEKEKKTYRKISIVAETVCIPLKENLWKYIFVKKIKIQSKR